MSARLVTVATADRLDRVARTIYGTESEGTVDALLAANPGLAAAAGIVPAGTDLVVPDTVVADQATAVRPWI